MSAYRTNFDETECMLFLMKEKISEKYNEIWEKVSNISKKEFNSEPVPKKKYLKAEKKSYNEKNQHKRRLSMFNVFIYQ